MGGVNLYNFIWIVQDLQFDLKISAYPNYFLAIALLLLLIKFGRKTPLLQSMLAIMFAYFLFGRVVNEQFLVAIFPLVLLCRECDYRIWIAPFIFIFLRSSFYYFMIPILWTSPFFYGYYLQADQVWRQLQAAGYLQIPMYAVGVAFSLLILWNLLQLIDGTRSGLGSVPSLKPLPLTGAGCTQAGGRCDSAAHIGGTQCVPSARRRGCRGGIRGRIAV